MPHIIGNLDDLITNIQHIARGDSQQKQAEAEQQAEEILAEARQAAEQTRQEILSRAETQAEEKRRQRLAEAVLGAKRDYLTAREDLLNQVWQQAEEQLRSLSDEAEAYADILGRLARLAVQALGPGRFRLAAEPKGHELLTEARLKDWGQVFSEEQEDAVSFERAAEPIESWGGLVVIAADSRRQVDMTFPTRLALARDELRNLLFERLVQKHD